MDLKELEIHNTKKYLAILSSMCVSSDPSPVEPQPGVNHAVVLSGNSTTSQSMSYVDDINIVSIDGLAQNMQINNQV